LLRQNKRLEIKLKCKTTSDSVDKMI